MALRAPLSPPQYDTSEDKQTWHEKLKPAWLCCLQIFQAEIRVR